MRSTRRQVLLALPFMPTLAAATPAESLTEDIRRLCDVIVDGRSAARVGAAVLHASPEPLHSIFNGLMQKLDLDSSALDDIPDLELRGRVMTAIRTDFVERNTVDIEGWLLSRTEARICALRALDCGLRSLL